jgi:hypothetical protein
MSQAPSGLAAWLSNWVDAAVKPRRTTDGQRLLLLTATPAAIVMGVMLLRHVSYHGSLFAATPASFTDATA